MEFEKPGDYLMRFADIHCHLLDSAFDFDREQVIEEARRSGIFCIIESTQSYDEIQRAVEMSQKHRGLVYISIGFDCTNFEEEDFRQVMLWLEKPWDGVVGVGEVGLDYYWVRDMEKRVVMARRFKEFFKTAERLNLPLIVHSRSAGKYAVNMLKEWGGSRVVLHAFDGNETYIRQGIQAGFYFSIPPSIVRSKQKKKLAKLVPLERMLLESDAPVLSPDPTQRNVPQNVRVAAAEVASIKSCALEDVAEVTSRNAEKLFKIF